MIRVAKIAGAAAIAAISLAVPASAEPAHGRVATHHVYRPSYDRPLYNVVPQGYAPGYGNPDDPANTGGGSLGYNLMIYNS
jgi:hypothetical protein